MHEERGVENPWPSRLVRLRIANLKEFQMDLIRLITAILLPPLGVFLQVGIGLQFWINVLLTLMGYVPGIVHAVWIIATRPRLA